LVFNLHRSCYRKGGKHNCREDSNKFHFADSLLRVLRCKKGSLKTLISEASN
jgi:hypothetical protein